MSWPLSQDFNEAVQNPATAFGDPDLKGGAVTTNPMGMPVPRSGNYADVYQVTAAGGQKWAVKCFTRPTSAGLAARYAAVSEHLAAANLPFTVGFGLLPQGIRIRGQWYPIVKMQWVDGFPINAFVRDNLNRSTILENMLSLWVRLCRRLRETGMAHGDIQHGNVLLVPAGGNSLGLKLVDYDGVFVPALADQPSGEAGHASYQHPERVTAGVYSADLDRFPHLVVATALRGLLVGGKAMWDQYDNGDNLLFTEKDFKNPGQSKLMKQLWETGDPFTVGLVGHLALACTKPLHQTPWLDQLMPGGQPPILTPSQERQAATILGFTPSSAAEPAVPPGSAPMPALPPQPPGYGPPPGYGYPPGYGPPPGYPPMMPPQQPVAPPAAKHLDFDAEGDDPSAAFDEESQPRRRRRAGSNLIPAAVAAVVILGGIVAATVLFAGGGKKPDVAQKPPEENPPPVDPGPKPVVPVLTPVEPGPKPAEPQPAPPKPVEPPTNPPPAVTKGKLVWSQPMGDDPRQPGRMGRFSLDGQRILSARQQAGVVDVYDAKTGRKVTTYAEHEAPAMVFAFPVPGSKVVSVGREPVMMVWDQETGRTAARVPMADPKVGWTAVRADRVGKFAVLVKDDDATVLDLESGRAAVTLKTLKVPFNMAACAIRPDGSAVLSVTPDYKLRVTAVPSGQTLGERAMTGGKSDKLGIVSAWSPDGKFAVLHEADSSRIGARAFVVAVDTGAVVKEFPGAYQIEAAFSGDGRRLAVVQHATVESVDTATWEKVAEADFGPQPAERLTDLDATADGSRVIVTTHQRTHYLVSVAPAAGPAETNPPAMPAVAAGGADKLTEIDALATADAGVDVSRRRAVDRTGKLVFFATDTAVYPVDRAAKKVTNRYAPDGQVRQIWATTGGELVVEVRKDKKVELHVVDPVAGKLVGPGAVVVSPAADDQPRHVNVSANGGLATVVKANGHLVLFDLKGGKLFYNFHTDLPAVAAYPSSDGERILLNAGKQIQTLVVAKRPQYTWMRPDGFNDVPELAVEDAAPDASAVALRSRGADNTGTKFTVVTFADWKNPAVIATAAVGNDAHLRFVGDGRRVVVSGEGRLTLHDAATGKAITSVTPKAVGGNMTPAAGPGGEVVVFGFSTGATVYRTGVAGPAATDPPPAMAGPKRLPVPDAAALAAAEKTVKDTYSADYAKKLPADRKKLADKLYTAARETATDAAAQYFLLKDAAAIAADAGDAALVVKATDAANEIFDVDGFALKHAALEKIAAGTTNTTTLKATAEAIQDVVEEAAERDEFDKAVKLAALAVSCYSRAGAAGSQKELDARSAQLKKLRDAFEAVKPAAEKLKTTPADPAANSQLGRFRAFAQGRWDDAFKLLAAGSDAELKKLADLELAAATDADTTELKRGDLWKEYAAKQPEPDRAAAMGRAKHWYAQAILVGKGGLDKATAEKNMSFPLGGVTYWPGLVAEYSAPRGGKRLKGVIEYGIDLAADAPAVTALSQTPIEVKWTGVIVPPTPGRYKLVAETRDAIRVTLGAKPDQKKVLDTADRGVSVKEGSYLFGERPVPIVVEFGGPTRRGSGLKLKWVRPGGKIEELIPPSAFYHNKADEKNVTEK